MPPPEAEEEEMRLMGEYDTTTEDHEDHEDEPFDHRQYDENLDRAEVSVVEELEPPSVFGARGSFAPPPVYANIHRIRRLIRASIDDPYTMDHFHEPKLNALVVRPLVDRIYDAKDSSTIYCLLANRVYFLREQTGLSYQSVNSARATLCELLASRVFRRFHEDHPGDSGLLLLAHVLVEGYDPFQGAPNEVERRYRPLQWPVQERKGHERKLTALELAIISESKFFISTAAFQLVVDAVHTGQVTYTPLSFIDILPDHYEHLPITMYHPRKSHLLNHHRLKVPRIRGFVELFQFVILFFLYFMTMHYKHEMWSLWELAFCIYTAGWVLQEFAAVIEHGWELHSQSLWSFLDISFIAIYAAYFLARIFDLVTGRIADGYGLSILTIAAPIVLTRIAFNLLPNNIVFISLHAMMRDFTILTFIGIWCFTGFLLALQWLLKAKEASDPDTPNWMTICKWLLWIWFGLDGTGIDEAAGFHIILGPALMISFAFLGNTLFSTILVAMLTNTFSRIITNEKTEIKFRRTVMTFEGVKSDSIFSYPPPFNIAALVLLLPLKLVMSEREFHYLNVFLVQTINAPLLLIITCFERQLWAPKKEKSSWAKLVFTGFWPHGDINAVLKADPPPELIAQLERLDPIKEISVLEDDLIAEAQHEVTHAKLRRAMMGALG
ncbi:unnamed protein product [Clonostachys byssicola]|uniref:Nonselective cation channel n=1 Tax=Clonostachys byssicola TaxID=160290 RepID=A0A9N9U7G0_9HYPO|nr:unnamed protein product [Clonostachys byssicola]